MTPPVCAYCKARLTTARVVIGEMWVCGDCAYWIDRGRTKAPARTRPQDAPQPELPFPPPEAAR